MIVWIVSQVDDYEGWNAKAYFTNEADAIACRDALRERDRADVIRLRTALGKEWDKDEFFNEYEAHPVTVHGTFSEWEQAGEWLASL